MKCSPGLLEAVFHRWGRQYNLDFYPMVISMFDNFAIRVQRLRKGYIIGGLQDQYHMLRDAIADLVNVPFNRVSCLNNNGI